MLTLYDTNGNKFTFYNANFIESKDAGYTDYYTDSEKKTWVARLNANGVIQINPTASYSVEQATFSNLEELIKQLKNETIRGKLSVYQLARLKKILYFFDGKRKDWKEQSQLVIDTLNL